MNFILRASNYCFAIFKHPASYQFFEMGEIYICIIKSHCIISLFTMPFGVMALLNLRLANKKQFQLNASEIVFTSLEFSRALPQKYSKNGFREKG